jgi:hypothetical protein
MADAESVSSTVRSASSAPVGTYGSTLAPSQFTASTAFAYGSISSFAGLNRFPCLVVWAVHAVAVALPRPRAVAVPVERHDMAQLDALFSAGIVE